MFRLVELAYLMLPAYFANMAPPFAKHWRGLNRPISHRWLGDHRTVAGFVLGVLAGVLTAYAQSRIDWSRSLVSPSDWLIVGLAQSFRAMAGDAIKSLIKRRRGIAPGQSWIPADQVDFPIGALVLLWPWVRRSWLDVVAILPLAGDMQDRVRSVRALLQFRDGL
jgi:CDP-2,3-bis-(O-geranylgeranyl)-sn-glycerol synthase